MLDFAHSAQTSFPSSLSTLMQQPPKLNVSCYPAAMMIGAHPSLVSNSMIRATIAALGIVVTHNRQKIIAIPEEIIIFTIMLSFYKYCSTKKVRSSYQQ